jgi:hypothetical protein
MMSHACQYWSPKSCSSLPAPREGSAELADHRYADDFVVLVRGTREDAETLREDSERYRALL